MNYDVEQTQHMPLLALPMTSSRQHLQMLLMAAEQANWGIEAGQQAQALLQPGTSLWMGQHCLIPAHAAASPATQQATAQGTETGLWYGEVDV